MGNKNDSSRRIEEKEGVFVMCCLLFFFGNIFGGFGRVNSINATQFHSEPGEVSNFCRFKKCDAIFFMAIHSMTSEKNTHLFDR